MRCYIDMLLESPLIDVVDARDGYAVAVDWLLDRGATLEMAQWSVTAARLERDARWKDRYLVMSLSDLRDAITKYWNGMFRENRMTIEQDALRRQSDALWIMARDAR